MLKLGVINTTSSIDFQTEQLGEKYAKHQLKMWGNQFNLFKSNLKKLNDLMCYCLMKVKMIFFMHHLSSFTFWPQNPTCNMWVTLCEHFQIKN